MIRIPGLPQSLQPCLERPPVSGDAGLYGSLKKQNSKNRQLCIKRPNRKKRS